jgi:hypothetical protein
MLVAEPARPAVSRLVCSAPVLCSSAGVLVFLLPFPAGLRVLMRLIRGTGVGRDPHARDGAVRRPDPRTAASYRADTLAGIGMAGGGTLDSVPACDAGL